MFIGNQRLNTSARTLARIFEIVNWGLVIFFGAFIFCALYRMDMEDWFDILHLYFPTITPAPLAAILIVVVLFAVSILYFVFSAFLWFHIRMIFDVTSGKDNASIGPTPFQPENVQHLKRAGIYAIVTQGCNFLFYIPLVIFSMDASIISNVVFSPLNSLAMILFLFCLAQFFAYGVQLQQDSDGLV